MRRSPNPPVSHRSEKLLDEPLFEWIPSSAQTPWSGAVHVREFDGLTLRITFVPLPQLLHALRGIAVPGTGGIYRFTITAHNGAGSDATQSFTLTITESPTGKKPRKKGGGVAVAEPAQDTESVPMQAFVAEEFEETFVEIYAELQERVLVTCIEVLSPSNKRRGTEGWAQYERNQAVLAANAASRGEDRKAGPAREGCALLQGVVICGRCGLRMTVGDLMILDRPPLRSDLVHRLAVASEYAERLRKVAETRKPFPGRYGFAATRRPFGPPRTTDTSGRGPPPYGMETTSPRAALGTRIGT